MMKKAGWAVVGAVLFSTSVWANEATEGRIVMIDQAKALLKEGGSQGKDALTLLQPLAKKSDGTALLWMGRIYRDGLGGVSKDAKRAFSYFERAAGKEGKNAEAQYELARAYYQGEGTDKNLIGAFMWASVSLQQPSGVEAKAKALENTLTGILSKEQLASAKTLVQQIHPLYLD